VVVILAAAKHGVRFALTALHAPVHCPCAQATPVTTPVLGSYRAYEFKPAKTAAP
jgi:hypothetical protein